VPRKLITIRDICEGYGLSDKTVRNLIKTGVLTAYRCGPRLIKLDADQVEAALMRPINGTQFRGPDRELADRLGEYTEKVVSQAPAFTREQVDQLHVLLEPARRDLANTGAAQGGGGDAA
jgi:excisionase family DNA binding protein